MKGICEKIAKFIVGASAAASVAYYEIKDSDNDHEKLIIVSIAAAIGGCLASISIEEYRKLWHGDYEIDNLDDLGGNQQVQGRIV